MKKLKLNLAQLNNTQVLTRSQLKNVLGGGGMGTTMLDGGKSCTQDSDCGTRTVECDYTTFEAIGRCNPNGNGGLVCVYAGCPQ